MAKCKRCDEDAKKGERYCKECRKDVLAEMKSDGYLQTVPLLWGNIHCSSRIGGEKENIQETKHGRD